MEHHKPHFSSTKITEMMGTLQACHIVAATPFFDRNFTPWTRFCASHDCDIRVTLLLFGLLKAMLVLGTEFTFVPRTLALDARLERAVFAGGDVAYCFALLYFVVGCWVVDMVVGTTFWILTPMHVPNELDLVLPHSGGRL